MSAPGDTTITCRVCLQPQARRFAAVEGKQYWRCGQCAATFLDAEQLPDASTERQQYLLHQNNVDDAGYRRFLSRLADPLLEQLSPGLEGLDYGCGPGPALALMMAEAGHTVQLYDPFFHSDMTVLGRTYDFITCTEAAEHFHQPAADFRLLDSLLRPGGWLAIMTCFQTLDEAFGNWHYRRDPTHVVFYKAETFSFLAGQFGWNCQIPAPNIVLMQKNSPAPHAGPAAKT